MNDMPASGGGRGLTPPLSAQCQVLLTELEVMADIGALMRERGVPQPLRISVVAEVIPPDEDELSRTLDYCDIRSFALQLAAEPIVLVETFAVKLARMCLALDRVLAIQVRVDKPRAVPDGVAGTCVKLAKCRM